MPHQAIELSRSGHCVIARMLEPVDACGLTRQAADQLVDLLDELEADDRLRVLVFAYEGASTSAGAAARVEPSQPESAAAVAKLAKFARPVIAAIAGDAFGFALEMGLACDLRIGVTGARYGLPQVRDGLIPFAGATQRLPRLIGSGKALEMILTGEPVDASEAHRIALVNRIVPVDELLERAAAMASAMAAASPVAVNFTKEALNNGQDLTLDQGMRMELDLYLLLFTTRDRIEGISAFRQKRKPDFEGA
ncbi:MAG: enoyl-CoA hydratase/isomerase family protein [Burkholderiaceae bacterium]|nr:enoyl-CoA hydratase/isomerase family protein [Burkholderiaceae bacterium]